MKKAKSARKSQAQGFSLCRLFSNAFNLNSLQLSSFRIWRECSLLTKFGFYSSEFSPWLDFFFPFVLGAWAERKPKRLPHKPPTI